MTSNPPFFPSPRPSTEPYAATWLRVNHTRAYSHSSPRPKPGVSQVEKISRNRLILASRSQRSRSLEPSDSRLVASLTQWNRTDLQNAANAKVILEAEFALKNRMKYNEIDHFILDRKSKNVTLEGLVRSKSQSSFSHVQEITLKRMQRRAELQEQTTESKNARRYEDEMTENAEKLKKDIEIANNRREALRKSVTLLRTQLESAAEIMEKVRKYYVDEDQREKKKMRNLRPEDLAKVLSRKSVLQSELLIREKEYAETVTRKKQEISDSSHLARQIDTEIASLRLQLQASTTSQVRHYLKLLSEGRDTRTEGLTWIIIKLWGLGQAPELQHFPAFLDPGAVECILFLSQKKMELEELTAFQASLQANSQVSGPFASHFDRWNNVRQRLTRITKNLRLKKPVFRFDKRLKQTIVTWEPVAMEETHEELHYKGTKEAFNEVLEVGKARSAVEKLLKETQTAEVQRLTRECFLHHYEEKYKVTMTDLLAAVLGQEAVEHYMPLIEKDRKDLQTQLARCHTFVFRRSA